MVFMTVTSQILVKIGSKKITSSKGVSKLFLSLIRPETLSAGALMLIAPFFYLIGLASVDLSTAYSFMALNYPFIALASWVVLGEKIKRSTIKGNILIVIGFLIFRV